MRKLVLILAMVVIATSCNPVDKYLRQQKRMQRKHVKKMKPAFSFKGTLVLSPVSPNGVSSKDMTQFVSVWKRTMKSSMRKD